jgi:tetratricopeptide (TPR) repeat protein
LHRRIAVALERTYAGHELEHAAEIAVHYHASAGISGAGDGVRYALAVAYQARAAFAHERAVAFLRIARVLATGSTPAERADILRRLALAEADALRLDEAAESGARALEAMDDADVEPRARAEFLAMLARTLKDCGARADLWEPLVDRGLSLVRDQRSLAWARLELLRDNHEPIRSGPISVGRWLGQDPQAIAIARSEGDEDDYARTLDPLDSRTRAETDAVLALVRTWSSPVAIIRGDLIYRHAAFREARMVHEELLDASERFFSVEARAEALAQIGASQGSTGDLIGFRESLSRAEEVVHRLGPSHRLQLVTTGLAIGLAYYLEGDWQLLGNAAKRYATSDASVRSPLRLIAACYAALCTARTGNATEARTWIEHVAGVSESIPITSYVQNWVIAEAATAVWEIEAAEHAARYARLLRELMQAGCGDPGVFGPLELSLARMATLQGDTEEAQEYFATARRKFEAWGHSAGQAIVDYDLASALGRSSRPERSQIVTLLDRALITFNAQGMMGWAGRAALIKEAASASGSVRSASRRGR